MRWKWIVGLAAVLFASAALAADRPVIDVSSSGLVPERIEVHVGETIRWRAERGIRMRIEFDPHRDAHEVIERAGDIRAVFTRAGEHWYVASIIDGGHRHVRGVVVVYAPDPSALTYCTRLVHRKARIGFALRHEGSGSGHSPHMGRIGLTTPPRCAHGTGRRVRSISGKFVEYQGFQADAAPTRCWQKACISQAKRNLQCDTWRLTRVSEAYGSGGGHAAQPCPRALPSPHRPR